MDLILKNVNPKDVVTRNFSGRKTDYTPEGRRSFKLRIAEEDALQMQADGWPIESWDAKDANGNPTGEKRYALRVHVRFDNFPPEIKMYSGGRMTILGENEVGTLDYAEIEAVGMKIHGSRWTLSNGRTGIKAYLAQMNVKIMENELDEEFAKYLDNDISSAFAAEDSDVPFDV